MQRAELDDSEKYAERDATALRLHGWGG